MDFNVDSFILLDVLCGKQGGGGRPFVHQILGSNNVAITFPLVEIRMFLSNVAHDVFNASFGKVHTRSPGGDTDEQESLHDWLHTKAAKW